MRSINLGGGNAVYLSVGGRGNVLIRKIGIKPGNQVSTGRRVVGGGGQMRERKSGQSQIRRSAGVGLHD